MNRLPQSTWHIASTTETTVSHCGVKLSSGTPAFTRPRASSAASSASASSVASAASAASAGTPTKHEVNQSAQSSVAIVCGVRNRCVNLKRALDSWLRHAPPSVHEIVIVDWGSTESLQGQLRQDPRVRILRVDNVPEWSITRCINFGVSQCKADIILKLDADILVGADFFNVHLRDFNHTSDFVAGDYKALSLDKDPETKYTSGVFLVSRHNYDRVNGFPECCVGYGWDELSLYDAFAQQLHLQRKPLNTLHVTHLHHSDEERGKELELSLHTNMFLCEAIPWHVAPFVSHTRIDRVDIPTRQVLKGTEHYKCLDFYQNSPRDSILRDCRTKAKRCILNKHGFPWSLTLRKDETFIDALYERRSQPKLYIQLLNGLGNRIRALASAAVVARASNRTLVIENLTTCHFNAAWESLFDVSQTLVSSKATASCETIRIHSDFSWKVLEEKLKSSQDIRLVSAVVFQHPATSWTKESQWIQENLILHPELKQQLDQHASSLNITNCIGIQIRMSQPELECESTEKYTPSVKLALNAARRQSHWYYFAREIESHWRAVDGKQRFFVCCDNPEALSQFLGYFEHDARLIILSKIKFDRSETQLRGAVLDAWLLAQCRRVWGSPWSSFTELVSRLKRSSVAVVGRDFGQHPIKARIWANTYNIGDAIQGIAVDDLVGEPDLYIERDQPRFVDSRGRFVADLNTFDNVKAIINGWFDGRLALSAFPAVSWKPLIISLHINESPDLFETREYQTLTFAPSKKLVQDSKVFFATAFGGKVGLRDEHSLHHLKGLTHLLPQVTPYHSCCLTLTLESTDGKVDEMRQGVYLVDLTQEHLNSLPVEIRQRGVKLSHCLPELLSPLEQNQRARSLLALYRRAEMVITTRLHAALPCRAFGTPIKFFFPPEHDCRFDDTLINLLTKNAPCAPLASNLRQIVKTYVSDPGSKTS